MPKISVMSDTPCGNSICGNMLSCPQYKRGNRYCSYICYNVQERTPDKRFCLHCGKETLNPKFCGHSCAASYNNKGVAHNPKKHRSPNKCRLPRKPRDNCLMCNKEFYRIGTEYCSSACKTKHIQSSVIELWKQGDNSLVVLGGDHRSGSLKQWARYWIKEQVEFTCQRCGWCKFHPVDNKPGVQIEHLDGNRLNQDMNNLDVLCPSCHWATSTFGARNLRILNGSPPRKKFVVRVSFADSQIKAIGAWNINNDCSGITKSSGLLNRWFLEWLRKEFDYTCSGCGARRFHPDDGYPEIQIEHRDGNNLNQSKDNLTPLCMNCHWGTLTYCNRNRNKQPPK